MIRFVVFLGILAGCIESNAVECGDRVCPQDSVCIELMQDDQHVVAGDPHRCVEQDAVAACEGIAELDECAAGACYKTTAGLVCLAGGCGNGLRDKLEVCDDGNADVGDGCSAACLSSETCGNGILDGLALGDDGVYQLGEVCDDANLLGHDGCASVCEAETPGWSNVTPMAPGGRMRAAMAYDPIRRRIVMFGGHRQSGPSESSATLAPLSDLWEHDGRQWVQQHPSDAPSARVGAAMAYDGARRVAVLFGGRDAHAREDMWAWNGTRWQRFTVTSSPPGRYRHGFAYDGRRKVVVVFGGTDDQGTALGDTWEWNGAKWDQKSPTMSPSARDAAMAYDPVRGVIVMLGAPAGGGYETWEYDGTTWTQKAMFATAAPPASNNSPPTSLAFDAATSRIVALGDTSSGGLGTYSWDGTTWTKSTAVLPATSQEASLAESPDGHVVAFGGGYLDSTGFSPHLENRNQTFVWNNGAWTELVIDTPQARTQASGVLDSKRRVVVVVGGMGSDPETGAEVGYQETLEYDGTSWTRLVGAPWSSGRYASSIAYDEGRDEIVVFGGVEATVHTLNSETWIRTGQTWTQASPTLSPPPRVEGAMAYDPVHHQVVLFGGSTAIGVPATVLGDTWIWDGSAWTDGSPANSPPQRRGAVLAWDPSLSQLVLFGGQQTQQIGGVDTSVELGDTWTWDGTAWTERITPHAPSARHNAGFAFDGQRRTLVLFGGTNAAGTTSDSWEWVGTEWQPLAAVDRPTAREGHVLASAPGGAGVFAFGGAGYSTTAGLLGDAQHMTWSGSGDYETCTLPIDTDGDLLAGCADPDCWARCTPTCSPRNVCDQQAPRCGDGTCSALEDCRICPADCTTCPDRCGDAVCDPAETAASCPGDCTP